MDPNKMNTNNLSAKERLDLFQNSLNKMVQENEVKNIRQLLHERYLKKKAEEEEEEEQKRKLAESNPENNNATKSLDNKKGFNNVKIGKQLAKVFRFENNNHQTRNRNHHRQHGHRLNRNHQEDIDPLLNDPNVLFENFAFDPIDDNDVHDENYRNLPFFPENPTGDGDVDDDQDIEDDSFKSLISKWLKSWTWIQIIRFTLQVIIYILAQRLANSYGFGAPFLILAALIFICMNLRKKSPHELSAYSVFNPNCRPLPTVSANEMPRDSILLGFGQGLGI